MWTAILNFVMGLFGYSKSDPVAQGEKLGKAETTEADTLGELADVQKASDARNAVINDPISVSNDPYNRGAADPDKP